MINEPLVAIRCITYNHEPYIRQCLEGFVMQRTNFPFIAIVHDDASTDGTAAIIREFEEKYPDIIKPIYETENQYSKRDGSLSRIMNAAIPECVKYIAFCEGDDYWTDPNKLQMQVDFLEKNREYGMCYTSAKQWIQSKGKFSKRIFGRNTKKLNVKNFEDLLFNGNRIPTLTAVVRHNLLNSYYAEINPSSKNWFMGDYPIWLYIAYKSNIKFFSNITGVYRFLENSASHSKNINKIMLFKENSNSICNFFSKKYLDIEIPFNYNFELSNSLFISKKNQRKRIFKLIGVIRKRFCP